MPQHVISVASDEAGNRFCLDLRSAKASPILMWDHEHEGAGPAGALKVRIADSFEEWLTQLTHDA